MNRIRFVLALLVLLLVAVLALQNNAPVEMKFLFWGVTVNRLFLFPTLVVTGVLLGLLLRLGVKRPRP